jgi:hypothetical protein
MRKIFPNSVEGYYFDPEALRHTLDVVADEKRINVLLDTFIFDAETAEGKIHTLKAVNKSGVVNVKAKIFIDASGDADIVASAGAAYAIGREEDGKTQAYSLRFMIGSVDVLKARGFLNNLDERPKLTELLRETEKKHKVRIFDADLQNFEVPGRTGFLAFNCPRVLNVNGVDGKSLSDGYFEARKIQRAYLALLKEHVPGCREAYIANTAESMGIRESRRLQGEYVITTKDVAEGRLFPDGVCGNCWHIDIHNPSGKGLAHDVVFPKGGYHDIPYRGLLTKEFDNLIVAGRCVSSSHEALASIRIAPTCIATGQAAGTAAAIAMESNESPKKINTNALRQRLVDQGALITGINL